MRAFGCPPDRTLAVGWAAALAALIGAGACSLDWPAPGARGGGGNGGAVGSGGQAGAGGDGGGIVDALCAMCPAQALNEPDATAPAVTTHMVPAGGDLQAAIDAAQAGDIIQLTAGVPYPGTFVLPVKAGDAPIRIQTGDLSDIAPRCTRVRDSDISQMAQLVGQNREPALYTDGGRNWQLVGIHFRSTGASTGAAVVTVGSRDQTSASALPDNIVFDRVYVSGDPVYGTFNGIVINGSHVTVMNSRISELWEPTAQGASHAVVINNSPGDVNIINNRLQSAWSVVALGTSAIGVDQLVPQNIVVRNNHGTKPSAWNNLVNPPYHVRGFVKAHNVSGLTIDANVFDNALFDAAIKLAPHEHGGAQPWSRVDDITISNNRFTHVDGRDFQNSGAVLLSIEENANAANPTQQIQVDNNLMYDSNGRVLQLGAGTGLAIGAVSLRHNTFLQSGTFGVLNEGPHDSLTIEDNAFDLGEFGLVCNGAGLGTDCLNLRVNNWLFDYNLIKAPMAAGYPALNNVYVMSDFGFLNASAQDYRLSSASPGSGNASDGSDRGVDFAAFAAAAVCRSDD